MMKRCIFHIPYELEAEAKAAPMLRPAKMIEAFESIGYAVDVVSGYAKERAKRIKAIEKNILNGVKYDFMYAESSTMPTLLTEKHHLPLHPFLDFNFFAFVKEHGIKIGLFYRDIYWKFDDYKKLVIWWKAYAAIANYKYDLQQYKKYLNKIYLPSLRVHKYLPEIPSYMVDILPPGALLINEEKECCFNSRDYSKRPLQIFYVGGVGNQYQIKELLVAVCKVKNCRVTICCRKDEYEKEKNNLAEALSENIEIVHASGKNLEPYYKKADICSLLFKPDIYREMAIPYKTFEYLSHLKPMIASQGTAIGDFVSDNNIGWTINYSADEIERLLNKIIDGTENLEEKYKSCVPARDKNTWQCRALKVAGDLM